MAHILGRMEKVSAPALLVVAVVLSFLASVGGSLLALRLDNPEIVVTERVVEFAPTRGPPVLAQDDLEALSVLYAEMTGEDEDSTLSLVHEIGGMVCEGTPSASAVLEGFGSNDISMNPDDFETFVEQVRAVCPD